MKKIFLVTLGFLGLVALSCAVTKEGNGNTQYQNLKILPKNISKEQMDSVMHHFTASLNVKCNFCHVRNEETKQWDWASDANKHKLIARQMMTMTHELNKKYFDVTGAKQDITTPLMVTCYSCHNGHKEPLTQAPKQQAR